MSGRRGFLALVGGAFVSGGVKVGQAARPTLIVPAGLALPPLSDAPIVRSRLSILEFGRVMDGLPRDLFDDWLAGGLRMVKGCEPGGQISLAGFRDGRNIVAEVKQVQAESDQRLAACGFSEFSRRRT